MTSPVEISRSFFLGLPAEIRFRICQFYATDLSVEFSGNEAIEIHSAKRIRTQLRPEYMEEFKTSEAKRATFGADFSHVRAELHDPEHHLDLFRTCRQLFAEGYHIILSHAVFNFRERFHFIMSFVWSVTVHGYVQRPLEVYLKCIRLSQVQILNIDLMDTTVFPDNYNTYNYTRTWTTGMMHILSSSMSKLKHLIFTIHRHHELPFSVPWSWFLRGLLQLRGIHSFEMAYHSPIENLPLGRALTYEVKLLEALQDTIAAELTAGRRGIPTFVFPDACRMMDCSPKDLRARVGRAMLGRLNESFRPPIPEEDNDGLSFAICIQESLYHLYCTQLLEKELGCIESGAISDIKEWDPSLVDSD